MKTLIVDPEFKAFIPPLSEGEREALREDLIAHKGALSPILTWRGIIVDGHNRYELCTQHKLKFKIQELTPSPASRGEALQWMFDHQCARRNLSRDQITILAAMRGVPFNARTMRQLSYDQATQLVAAGPAAYEHVLNGLDSILVAYNDMRRAQGHVPQYRPRVTQTAQPAPQAKPATAPTTQSILEEAEADAAERKAHAHNRVLIDELKVHRARWEAITALKHGALPTVKRRELGSGKREGCAVIMGSDWHIEETVEALASPLGNIYTPEVAAVRVGRFFSGTQWLIDNNRDVFGLRDVILWLGGDLLTGYIHDELKESNALSPTEAILWLKAHIIDGIEQLLSDGKIERLLVPCSYGNHGRTTMKPRRGTGGSNSWEWLLYMDLAKHFEHERRVEFTVEQSAHQYVRVYDFDLHFHHGDEISYGGGIGGITIPINKATSQWDKVKRCHYHHFGHFHQYLDLGQTVVNGSLIGYNAYAMSIKATPEVPQQAFYILDSKRGKTCKSPIWVSE